jgi:hypothetical protein
VRKDFIRPLRTLYKAPTRPLRSLKNPYKALRVFLLRHSTVIAIRQFLVYFQARDALGKSQGYLGSSVRQPVTQATSYTGNQLHRQPVAQATSYTGNQLHRQAVTQATSYTGNQ